MEQAAVYGEMSREGLQRLLSSLKLVQSDRFYDLGSNLCCHFNAPKEIFQMVWQGLESGKWYIKWRSRVPRE